jgi:hypothetical protein
MKTKLSLLQAGAFAGVLLLSAQAQSGGAGAGAGASAGAAAGGAAGNTGMNSSAGVSSSTGITTGTSSANTGAVPGVPSISNPNPGSIAPSTSTGTSVGVGGTVVSPGGAVVSPGGNVVSPGGTVVSPGGTVVSPGTAPIGPMPSINADSTSTTVLPGAGAGSPDVTGVGTEGRVRMPNPVGVGREPRSRAATTSTLPVGAPMTVTVPTPPPQLPDAAPTSPAPSAEHIWVPGHPVWNGQWSTTEGQWALPPQTGAVWVDGQFDSTTRTWRSGHWSTNPPPASR